MRILVTVSYNGSAYKGWAKQINTKTIQGTIEDTLSRYFDSEINVYASGRTDAGVHALGQAFHFDAPKEIKDLELFRHALNCMLPNDIHFIKAVIVKDDFHARYNAKGKEYVYQLYFGENDPFLNCRVAIIKKDFSVLKFAKALTYFYGKHNFQNFTSKEEDEKKFVRHIKSIKTRIKGKKIIIKFCGDGFMRYQIRYMVGTALAVAKGQMTFKDLKKLINPINSERSVVCYKAGPEGLYLVKVRY